MSVRRSTQVLVVAATVSASTFVGAGGADAAVSQVTPMPAATASADTATSLQLPLLRRGSSGQPVRSAQYLLRAHGHHEVAVDGDFGPVTEAAVKAFQGSEGLTADGQVGNQTWPKLLVTVRLGQRGNAVRAVQDQFQFRNLSGDPTKGLRVDGIFGPRTDSAVRAFQRAVGLRVDGVVGPRTWNQLVNGALSF